MMGDPAVHAVIYFRRPGARFRDVLNHFKQRLGAFRQVADLGGPVVHLGVDVDSVLAAPGRKHLLIPYTLQVGRLAAGAAAGEQNVTAELKHQSLQVRIASSRFHSGEPLVNGLVVLRRVANLQMNATHQSAEIRLMSAAKACVVLTGAVRQDLLALSGWDRR